jgi:hypothetical protein
VKHISLLLVLAGCSSGEPDASGEAWATKTLGDAGARTLKMKARGVPPAGELGAAWAPRPLVVIELVSRIPGGEGDPMFHPLNASLSGAPKTADEVQGVVLVKKWIHSEFKGTIRIKRRNVSTFSHKEVQVVTTLVRDENGRFFESGGDFIEGHEDAALRAFVEKLPQAAPAE